MLSQSLDAAPASIFAAQLSRPLRPAPFRHVLRLSLAIFPLLLLLAAFVRPARAEKDSVEFFNNVDIAHGQEADDVVVFFGNANIDGDAKGDIVVIFGNVNLRGTAHHDVVNIFGSIHLYDGASVGDDLVNIFGETRMGENTGIGNDSVVIFGSLQSASTASFGGNRVVQPFWLFFVPIVILALIIRGIIYGVRYPRRYRYMRGY